MGTIRTEVRDQHLNYHPEEEEILKAFLPNFFVTWGRRRRAYNTELSVYFLNPEPFLSETFGFDQEIMLVYSRYKTLEARSVQAAEAVLADDPARGRVEKLTYFFVSEAPDVEGWFHAYNSMHQESKLIIPLSADDVRANASDPWFVRNKTSNLLYGRDLFDYRLPLERDTYFFGRSELAVNLFDSIKRSENRGIFGLRKTGKTSLLFKLERMLKEAGIAEVQYFDCKLPSIRKLRWHELLWKICEELAKKFSLQRPSVCSEVNAPTEFMRLASEITKPVLLVFDEIEYISPIAIDDKHWHRDFIAFWQTFWACQSRHRTISAMIAGVNPKVVEMDTIEGVQNPLFGIVSYQFLTGLNLEETKNMIRTLGKRMGMKFDAAALEYIHLRYGGHPLLTRMACSATNSMIALRKEARPVALSRTRLESEEQQRDAELTFYCRHVVSELRQFYHDEYEMLELLASGQVHDFVELAAYPEYTKHLEQYGLLAKNKFNRPEIAIPVISRYVGLELARKEGRRSLLRVAPEPERDAWIEKRKKSVLNDIRMLESAINRARSPLLFGANSFPNAHQFASLTVVRSEADFKQFVDVCNKCFVESIENYGKSIGKDHYYWQDVKTRYPGLWDALQRIKIYRNEHLHLILNEKATDELIAFLKRDLEGRSPSAVPDVHFVLQQCTLDGLLAGIQIEIGNLT